MAEAYARIRPIEQPKPNILDEIKGYLEEEGIAPSGFGDDGDLSRFSLNGQSKNMEKQLLDDVFVLNRIAILGQFTAIYAKPNTGKTLITMRLLIDAVKSRQIDGNDIYYINADDSFKGLLEKLKLAESVGIQMLCPGHHGFDARLLVSHIRKMADTNTARGKVLILDTLKKFCDLMDKKRASDFMQTCRLFTSKGGTVVALAHTNKRRDDDKKLIFGGTSDVVDDCDCAYTIDEIAQADGKRQVRFENIKARGDVAREANYEYLLKADNYSDLLDSVKALSDDDIADAEARQRQSKRLADNADSIEAITQAIQGGSKSKLQIVKAATEASGIPRRKIEQALRDHTGDDFASGHRWNCNRGGKNALEYRSIDIF